ncbi:MAG: threonine ammonia-lyase [Nannocystales bacterium]
MSVTAPTLSEIRSARERLGDAVRTTAVWTWTDDAVSDLLGPGGGVHLKLEAWQHTSSFKPRGALLCAWDLDDAQRARGLTAVSAGNHAAAVAFTARTLGSHAKVVMPQTASPSRVDKCRRLGAEVLLAEDVHQAFATVERIQADEGRTFIHPFEGPTTALGTATVGLEWLNARPDLDAVVVPIGGGGLCAGIAAAVKQLRPQCKVYGVEPIGADSMTRSLAAGAPVAIDRVATIADSLGAPHAAPYSFELCRRFVDEVVTVDDDALCEAMVRLFAGMKLAVEPAGAAATAALWGPLRDRLQGKQVGLLVCGANIDPATFSTHLARGTARLSPA